MRGYNGVMSAANHGEYPVVVESIGFGVNIIATEASAKTRRAFYPFKRTSGSFGITLIFHPYPTFERFCKWFLDYGRRLASPDGRVGPMRVQYPARDFDRTAVPNGTWTIGRAVDEFTYRITIGFIGAREPVELVDTDLVSHFVGPEVNLTPTGSKENLAAPYFYPGGKQLSGSNVEDSLFNNRLPNRLYAGVRAI